MKVDIQTAAMMNPVEERNFNSQGARFPSDSLLRFDRLPIVIVIWKENEWLFAGWEQRSTSLM